MSRSRFSKKLATWDLSHDQAGRTTKKSKGNFTLKVTSNISTTENHMPKYLHKKFDFFLFSKKNFL